MRQPHASFEIRAVDYQLPANESKPARFPQNPITEYLLLPLSFSRPGPAARAFSLCVGDDGSNSKPKVSKSLRSFSGAICHSSMSLGSSPRRMRGCRPVNCRNRLPRLLTSQDERRLCISQGQQRSTAIRILHEDLTRRLPFCRCSLATPFWTFNLNGTRRLQCLSQQPISHSRKVLTTLNLRALPCHMCPPANRRNINL